MIWTILYEIANAAVVAACVAMTMLTWYACARVCLAMSAFFARLGCEPHALDRVFRAYVRWMERER